MGDVWQQIGRGCIWGALAVLLILGFLLVGPQWPHREHARRSSCLSNMKSLALATLEYAHDCDDRLPPAPLQVTPVGPVDVRDKATDMAAYFPVDDWHRRIQYRNDQVFVCPSTGDIYSYQFNAAAYGLTTRQMPNPGRMLLEYETGYVTGMPEGPHDGGYNVTYCDGHATWRKSSQSQSGR